jgi:hypothetical protein
MNKSKRAALHMGRGPFHYWSITALLLIRAARPKGATGVGIAQLNGFAVHGGDGHHDVGGHAVKVHRVAGGG